MLGLAILFGFEFLGMWLHAALHLPLPANVVGLILFTFCLFCGVVKLEWVEVSAHFFTRHMLLFFTPFVVATMVYLPFLKQNVLSIGISVVASTLITLAVTGWVTKWLAGRVERASEEGRNGA